MITYPEVQHQTLGKGKFYFAQYTPGTQTPGGERYFGYTGAMNVSLTEEKAEAFDSDNQIRKKTESATLSVMYALNFDTSNISIDNLASAFLGEVNSVAQGAAAVTDEAHTVEQGLHYQLGQNATNVTGVRNISAVTVTDSAGVTTYTVDTDYQVDLVSGRLFIVPGGGIASGAAEDILVDYTTAVEARDQVKLTGRVIQGAGRFIADNPAGENKDYYWPYIKLGANGDFSLKGDEFQTLPFTAEVLEKDPATAAMYIDGVSA